MVYKMMSLFAGVGGIDLGFEMTGKFKTIWANEFDKNAAITYQENFDNELIIEDINNLEPTNTPDIDILLAGFPCQSFSVAGYRKGFEDERGELFFKVLNFINKKQPKIIFLENVKNLFTHDKGNIFSIICEALQKSNYHVQYQILNAKEYGNVPQSRERIYIVGFKDIETYNNFNFPDPIQLKTGLSDVIDFDSPKDNRFYYTAEKHSFYPKLQESITCKKTIYQWRRDYVRANKSNVVPTLAANMGSGGHNVPLILTDYGIRKLTPKECFNIQGFPEDYRLPQLALSHLYKQAGNSVAVPVIFRIAKQILTAINKTNSTVSTKIITI